MKKHTYAQAYRDVFSNKWGMAHSNFRSEQIVLTPDKAAELNQAKTLVPVDASVNIAFDVFVHHGKLPINATTRIVTVDVGETGERLLLEGAELVGVVAGLQATDVKPLTIRHVNYSVSNSARLRDLLDNGY